MEKIILEKLILNLLEQDNSDIVISFGGGSFINDKIRYSVKKSKAISLWLNVDLEIIFNRLAKSNLKRPLANNFNNIEKLKEMFDERIPYYKDADIEIKINKLIQNDVLNLACEKLLSYLKEKNEKN